MHSNVGPSHKILLQGYILAIKELWKLTVGSLGRFRFHIVLDEGSFLCVENQQAGLCCVQLASSWNLQRSKRRRQRGKGKVDVDG